VMSGPAGGHTAIVTGANHGIGAATATALGRSGCAVLCTFFRGEDPVDPGVPQAYRDRRAADADAVVSEIRAGGGRALAVEADLADPAVPAALFDAAEEQLGPVDILVNNATGWVADTFAPAGADRLGRSLRRRRRAEGQLVCCHGAGGLPGAREARRHPGGLARRNPRAGGSPATG